MCDVSMVRPRVFMACLARDRTRGRAIVTGLTKPKMRSVASRVAVTVSAGAHARVIGTFGHAHHACMQNSWFSPHRMNASVVAAVAAGALGTCWAQSARPPTLVLTPTPTSTSTPAVVLGQPLNFSVQLRTDSGEPITPQCITAEVTAGERRLTAAQVRTALDTSRPEGAQIRVTTLMRIEEPVVNVQLTVGCQARVTRSFLLMAEPAVNVPAAKPAATSAQAARTSATQRSERRPAPAARRAIAERTPPASARAAPAGPRLQLDPAEPVLSAESAAVEQAIEVVFQATGAMRAAMAAASAAELRSKTLEMSVDLARSEATSQRDLAQKLQTELAAAESASRWVWPLQLGLLAAALLAAGLAWRLWKRPARPQAVAVWRDATESIYDDAAREQAPGRLGTSPTSPTPFVVSDMVLAATVPPAPAPTPTPKPRRAAALAGVRRPASFGRGLSPSVVPSSPPPASERTAPQPVGLREGNEAPRDVSIEELIDLEQQADFFVVLGQDGAAVDLLVEHLRLTGGGSPLPYLKLMEIYHRLGDQAAYERTRGRFNDRFNAYAPAWEAGLQQGRGLEEYLGVVPRLTQVWARPLDAMAELEALLFRKSRGDLFELPAYRDVLFLYALARDLFDRESADTANVDLLLPLNALGDLISTRPAPFDEADPLMLNGGADHGARPTSPVDLDLSTPDKATSIFNPFDPRVEPVKLSRR